MSRFICTSLSSPVYGRTAPDIAGYISICASFSLLAFSGLALLLLVGLYLYQALFLLLAQSPAKIP